MKSKMVQEAYRIVTASHIDNLEKFVGDLLAQGYVVVGGPFTYGTLVCQAVMHAILTTIDD